MSASDDLINQGSGVVSFERGVAAHLIAIDGTWQRPCIMQSVSQRGATLSVDVSITGLSLKEFFLSLSSFGAVYRRCELEHVNGSEIGVIFLGGTRKPKQ